MTSTINSWYKKVCETKHRGMYKWN